MTIETPALDEDRDVVAEAARMAADVETLRPGQREAVEAVLVRDTIAVLATGTGKTAIYETAGYLLDGPTLVISPTIALQRDQVQSLREHGHPTASISSARSERTRREALEDFAAGQIEMLLLAPEQLGNAEVLDEIEKGRPEPARRRRGALRERVGAQLPARLPADRCRRGAPAPSPRAGADGDRGARVRRDIASGSRCATPRSSSATRTVPRSGSAPGCSRATASATRPGRGGRRASRAVIVYAPTRRRCAELAAALAGPAVRPRSTTPGCPPGSGVRRPMRFLAGRAQTIVATNAFGMGVDRPDVRAVLHAGPPTSVDQYFQEAGRAARDGEPGRAELFFRLEDFALGRYLESGGGVREDDLTRW